eukprot:2263913-Rhodomonas_salina.5
MYLYYPPVSTERAHSTLRDVSTGHGVANAKTAWNTGRTLRGLRTNLPRKPVLIYPESPY